MTLNMLGLKANTVGISLFVAIAEGSKKNAVGAVVSSLQETLNVANVVSSSFERVSLGAEMSIFGRNTGRGVNHAKRLRSSSSF